MQENVDAGPRSVDVLKIVQDPDNSLLLDFLHFICDIVEPPPRHLATSLKRYETPIALAALVSVNTLSAPQHFPSSRKLKSLSEGKNHCLCKEDSFCAGPSVERWLIDLKKLRIHSESCLGSLVSVSQ